MRYPVRSASDVSRRTTSGLGTIAQPSLSGVRGRQVRADGEPAPEPSPLYTVVRLISGETPDRQVGGQPIDG